MKIGSVEATLGSTSSVGIPVSVENLTDVAGLVIKVTYPEDALAVKDVTYNGTFQSEVDNSGDKANPVQIAWNAGSVRKVTYSGELCTINFDVLSTAKAGTYDITVVVDDAAQDGGKDITDDVVPVKGTLTLTKQEPHAITYPKDVEGGKVEVSAESAVAGTKITLTVTSNPGYGINALKWNNNVIATPYTFPYTFEMPDEDVTISVSFPKEGYNITYTLTPENGGSVVSQINGQSVNTAAVGDKVTLTPQAAEGFEYADGSLKVTGETSGDITLTNNEFTMPAEDVTVEAQFVKHPYEISYTSDPEAGGKLNGPKTAVVDEEVTVKLDVTGGYKASVTVKGTEDTATTVDVTKVNDTTYTFLMPKKDVTVTARFDKLYNITYVPAPTDGGTVTSEGNIATAIAGDEITLTATANEADDYHFVEFAVVGDESKTPVEVDGGKFVMPEENVTVTASFTQPAHTIESVAIPPEGGTVKSEPTSGKANASVTVTVEPATGYAVTKVTADGVELTPAADGTYSFNMPNPARPVKVEATFTRQQVTVTVVTNDGQEPPYTLLVTPGQKMAKLGDPIWNNHTFAGWFADEECKTEFDFDAPITEDTTIYAKWTVTVTFDANGGKFGESETTEVTATVGAPIVPPEENPTRDGYGFTGWLTEEDKDEKDATAVDFTALVAQNPVTFYAGWDKDKIPVTYQTTGSGTIDGPAAAKPGDTVTVKAIPSSDSVLFLGWNITSGGTEIYNDADSEEPKSEYTFTVPENATSVTVEATFLGSPDGGCYIATSVYGSYDTPEVWTLRRFRDDVLGQTWYGRLFIKAYYATSPTLVRWFGDAEWFQNFWRDKLDTLVDNLQEDGFESTPYQDKDW